MQKQRNSYKYFRLSNPSFNHILDNPEGNWYYYIKLSKIIKRVAENKGLIDKLGDVAFEKICKFISENKGVVNAVSVNFSVYQISSPNIVDKVLNTIEKFGLSPSNIIIEITESVFIENFELINSNIEKLANAGIKFYLDDFGTGYSNLTTVIALPFSTVKMDRSLVLTMEESNRKCDLAGDRGTTAVVI